MMNVFVLIFCFLIQNFAPNGVYVLHLNWFCILDPKQQGPCIPTALTFKQQAQVTLFSPCKVSIYLAKPFYHALLFKMNMVQIM